MKKRTISLSMALVISVLCALPVGAENISQQENVMIISQESQEEVCAMDIALSQERTEVNSESNQNGYLLEWETDGNRDILKGVEKDSIKVE